MVRCVSVLITTPSSSRYNLKRRVASLGPISSEIFKEKVLEARVNVNAQADKASFQKSCDLCQKHFSSENSFRNHLGSSKHKARASANMFKPNGTNPDDRDSVTNHAFQPGDSGVKDPTSSTAAFSHVESDISDMVEHLEKTELHEGPSPIKRPSNISHNDNSDLSSDKKAAESRAASSSGASAPAYSIKTCLFCTYESPTPPLNIVHMERIHGMFIPEKEYLVDLEGLLSALQRCVYEEHRCLVCAKVKSTVWGAQTHMRDKGHCCIPYTTEEEQLEIGGFYDFRSTYSDAEDDGCEDEDIESPAIRHDSAKLGARRSARVTHDDDQEVAGDQGWETDSSVSSVATADLGALPADHHYNQFERLDKHSHHSRDDPRAHHQPDGWHAHNHKRAHAVFYGDYELQLPSGRTVGHRSLQRYYRQNLYGHLSTEQHEAQRSTAEAAADMDPMTWTPTTARGTSSSYISWSPAGVPVPHMVAP